MSDPYTWLVSRLLFPLHETAKRHRTCRVLRDMEVSQWWDAKDLEGFRCERLRRFMATIGTHVPYYRRVFQEIGFDPHRLRDIADLKNLPLLGKEEIRENWRDMCAQSARGLCRFNTGGSSGEPLVFYLDSERVSHDVAAKWRATRWWGVDIGDPEVVVWGSPVELSAQDRLRGWRDRLLRSHLISAFDISDERLGELIQQIRAIRPRMLFGYPSVLARIASFAERAGVTLAGLGIRVAFVTAERLYDWQRATIERVFGCRVANGYGGRDSGFIAHECPAGGMHITAEDLVVEIVDETGEPVSPGVVGEIVVTHMATRAFPFVRYRTGDMGALSVDRCGCGRGLPLLERIEGRTTDFVEAADGSVLHGLALIYVVRELRGIRSFKIIQESRNTVRVLIVPDGEYETRNATIVEQGFRDRLGESVKVVVDLVGEIKTESSGKFRYVVSHIGAHGDVRGTHEAGT